MGASISRLLEFIRRRERVPSVSLNGRDVRLPLAANDDAYRSEPGKPTIVLLSWLALSVRVAQADGPLNQPELSALQRLFPSPELAAWIKAALRDELDNGSYLKRIAGLSEQPRKVAETIFPGMLRVAVADGHLNEPELALLRTLARPLDVGPARFDALLRHFHSQGCVEDIRLALTSPEGEDRGQIQSRFRVLCKRLHPDTLPQGLPPLLRELAELRFVAINDTYRSLTG